MSARRVLVIGAGAAGVAAALAAIRSGAETTIVDGGAAASAFMSGAVDLLPWERADALSAPLPDGKLWRAVLESFGLWKMSGSSALLASTAGALRTARGRDRALLDLETLRNASIAVPRVERPSFDADLLARGWNADPRAKSRGLRFEAVECEGLLTASELTAPEADVARALDEPERLRLAAACLGKAAAGFAAVLVGPWLGVDTDAAAALQDAIGIPVGETLSMLSCSAGARFERARERVLSEAGAKRVELAVDSLGRDRVWLAALTDGSSIEADAVVVAIGGMISGGVALAPAESEESDEFPAIARDPFRLSLTCDELCLRAGAARVEPPGSMQGPNLEDYGWPAVPEQLAVFERVGIQHDDALHAVDTEGAPIPGCFVAGAAAADLAHTLIAAIDSGARAGSLAAAG